MIPFESSEAPILRPYQTRAIDLLRDAWKAGKRAPILVLATGSGKTVIAAEIIRRVLDQDGRVLFLAPRRELVYQAVDKLRDVGVDAGLLMAGEDVNAYRECQVASVDTLVSRLLRKKHRDPPPIITPDLVIYDEAHLYVTKTRRKLLDLWSDARRVGLTATPSRKDGRALELLADDLIEPISVAELTEQGFLCPAKYYTLSEPDLERVKTVAGDWHQGQLEDACAPLVGDIVTTWLEKAGGRRTIVFGITIAHSAALSAAFQRAGVAAEHVDARTPLEERNGIMARYKSGSTQVLTNCFLAAYGFDAPETACIVLARPTKSLVLYLQMLGRGLRPAKDHEDCLILDHSGAVHWHGLATDPREWTLEGEYSLENPPVKKKDQRKEGLLVDCPDCHATFSGRPDCPECGYIMPKRGKMVETLAGELIELDPTGLDIAQDRQAFYAELVGFAQRHRYNPGWISHKYKERFGEWPPWGWKKKPPMPALIPSADTVRWIEAQRRKWLAESRERFGK